MEKSIKGTKTEQNLLKAFAGESQAKNRYEFFAKQATKEGFEQIASIFLKTALEEQSHFAVQRRQVGLLARRWHLQLPRSRFVSA